MDVVKNEQANQPEKMSYEQLENVARQLSQQNERMYQELQRVNMVNTFKRLDYLFKVIEYSNAFPSEFVIGCTEEVQTLMTPEEEKKEEENA